MENKNDRRGFLKKATVVTSGGLLAATAAFTFKSESENHQETKDSMPVIKRIQPLGFQWETQDPFLFCVHHEDAYPKGNEKQGPAASLAGRSLGQDFLIKDGWRMYHGKNVPGFPGHPHRGFETITVVREGMVDHTDSTGASGRYGNGDVQWMTSGKGVQHAEMFPLVKVNEDNPLELFQIWLNLPKKDKFVEPHFKMLWAESIPKYEHIDETGKVSIEVIAGKVGEEKAPTPPPNSWAFSEENNVAIWNIKMDKSAKWTLPKAKEGVNRTIYFYKGNELKIEGETLGNYHSADVRTDVDLVIESGAEESHILILQGKPIGEPVVQHGPFVMNTKEEIRQAFVDYQNTQFGGWPWSESGPVHPRTKGRFAEHADGKLEDKS